MDIDNKNHPPDEVTCQEELITKPIHDMLNKYGLSESPLISGSITELESRMSTHDPVQPEYGSLPFYSHRHEFLTNLEEELNYFEVRPIENPESQSTVKGFGEGLLLFELKFGFSATRLCEFILENYPPIDKMGRIISVFGLSGSGKSTTVNLIKSNQSDSTVVIDNDTARFNLLASLIVECEKSSGKTIDEIRNSHLIFNQIGRAFDVIMQKITRELSKRGYTVIRASVLPNREADEYVYIEHPERINPTEIDVNSPQEIDQATDILIRRTNKRMSSEDNYDWYNPKLVARFEDMQEVTVNVPSGVHRRFILLLAESLGRINPKIISNPNSGDIFEAQERIGKQLLEAGLMSEHDFPKH